MIKNDQKCDKRDWPAGYDWDKRCLQTSVTLNAEKKKKFINKTEKITTLQSII
jgi:hypothetical protein